MTTIQYDKNTLVIKLKTSDPAALHAQLMHSIAANMHSLYESKRSNDIAPLINLLQSILPNERELEKAFS